MLIEVKNYVIPTFISSKYELTIYIRACIGIYIFIYACMFFRIGVLGGQWVGR